MRAPIWKTCIHRSSPADGHGLSRDQGATLTSTNQLPPMTAVEQGSTATRLTDIRQARAGRDGQLVVGRRRGGLGGVDMQPERQRGVAAGRDRHRLGEGVGVAGAVAVHPGVPGAAVRRPALRAVLADHTATGRPGGGAGFEAGVRQLLARAAGRWGGAGGGRRGCATTASSLARRVAAPVRGGGGAGWCAPRSPIPVRRACGTRRRYAHIPSAGSPVPGAASSGM
jgi:hypothetical protein